MVEGKKKKSKGMSSEGEDSKMYPTLESFIIHRTFTSMNMELETN